MKAWILATTLAPLAIATAILAPGCVPSEDDPLACRDGSCEHQGDKTFCDIDGVYSGTERANECIAPPSDDACNRASECTDATRPQCSDESMGTCVECTDNAHCSGDQSCDTRVGECTDEPIFTCTPGTPGNADCSAEGVGLDYCGDGDICVACLLDDHCTGNAAEAICDDALFECRGCEENAECDSRLCGTNDEGVCVNEADVVYVDDGSGADVGGCGTVAMPCASIGRGIEAVTATRNVVLVATGTYSEQLDITDTNATLLADGAVTVNPGLGSEENALKVRGASSITVDGFIIEAGANLAGTTLVSCLGSGVSLAMRNSTVQGSAGLGIEASSQCTFDLSSSKVTGNDDGGIDIDDANFSIVNNFIVRNGDNGSDTGGMRIVGTNDRTERLEFNTVAFNQRSGISAHAMFCDLTAVTASNNIFMLVEANSAGLLSGCNTSFSLIDSESTGNSGTATDNLSANASFVDAMNGNFHLASGSPGIDAAAPAATLATDIDGDVRPLGDGHDMGADEVE